MSKRSLEYLNQAVDYLKQLHFKTENIMVTGSIALDMQGVLPVTRPIHDVDLIVKMDDQSWRCMKLIEAMANVDKSKNKDYESGFKDMITLEFNNVKVNIWKHDNDFDWSTLKDTNTGVYVATVDHIIRAKKMYGRQKDWKDINEIVRNIL